MTGTPVGSRTVDGVPVTGSPGRSRIVLCLSVDNDKRTIGLAWQDEGGVSTLGLFIRMYSTGSLVDEGKFSTCSCDPILWIYIGKVDLDSMDSRVPINSSTGDISNSQFLGNNPPDYMILHRIG